MFGPDLVVLDPHENFNVLSLSGKRRRGEKGGEGRGEEREGRREKCRDYDHYIQLLQLVSRRKRMH